MAVGAPMLHPVAWVRSKGEGSPIPCDAEIFRFYEQRKEFVSLAFEHAFLDWGDHHLTARKAMKEAC